MEARKGQAGSSESPPSLNVESGAGSSPLQGAPDAVGMTGGSLIKEEEMDLGEETGTVMGTGPLPLPSGSTVVGATATDWGRINSSAR